MVKLSFLGDISLNDEYIDIYNKGQDPFETVSQVLKKSDLIIGNLECFAKGSSGENLLKNPRLKTDIETLNYLNHIGVNLVTLAHNHVYDNLLDGFNSTINFLENNNIQYMGCAVFENPSKQPAIKTINGITFCFLNYVTRDTNPNLPADANIYLNWFSLSDTINEIKKFRDQVDHIILLLHWGGLREGSLYPEPAQLKIARQLIDAGCDLIIGHHSHTLQPYEAYKDKYIFYSLGNFCFADIFNNGKLYKKIPNRQKESIILNINFTKDRYSFELIPIRNYNNDIRIDNSVLKNYKFRLSIFNVFKKFHIFWLLQACKYRYFDPIIFFLLYDKRYMREKLKSLNLKKIYNFLNK